MVVDATAIGGTGDGYAVMPCSYSYCCSVAQDIRLKNLKCTQKCKLDFTINHIVFYLILDFLKVYLKHLNLTNTHK